MDIIKKTETGFCLNYAKRDDCTRVSNFLSREASLQLPFSAFEEHLLAELASRHGSYLNRTAEKPQKIHIPWCILIIYPDLYC